MDKDFPTCFYKHHFTANNHEGKLQLIDLILCYEVMVMLINFYVNGVKHTVGGLLH